jgi:hypothetical protein
LFACRGFFLHFSRDETIENPEKIARMSGPGPGSNDQKYVVIALRCGRMGNRLVLFANFIAYCEEHGYRLSNITFHTYAHLFETTRRDIYCRYPASPRRSVFDLLPGVAPLIRKTRIFTHLFRGASELNEKFRPFGRKIVTLREIKGRHVTLMDDPQIQNQISDARMVFAHDWRFRAPDQVRRHAEKIRAYFRPLAKLEQGSRQAMARLRREADVVVGVHIRLGDNWKWKNGQYFFQVPQYLVWMNQVKEQFPGKKVAFFVCSDEPRTPGEFPGFTVELGTPSPVQDVDTLARCDYVFGPLSTFTQWASFYGNAPMLHLHSANDRVEMEKFRVSFLGEIP